jgi:hypothetical protein
MATVTRRTEVPLSEQDRWLVIADYAFDSSYPTGGEQLAASDFGLGAIEHVTAEQPAAGTRIVAFDPATQKVKLFTALSTEAANASDQSAIGCRLLVIGTPPVGGHL